MLKLIAVVARDGGIGMDGKLLFSIPEDLRRFKELTMGKTVIMGRATLDSLPGGRPLPGRRNLVLTRQKFCREGVETFHNIEALMAALAPKEEAWVMGGASIYEQFLSWCGEAYLTEVDDIRPADRFFPALSEQWKLIETSRWKTAGEISYRFSHYRRKTGVCVQR